MSFLTSFPVCSWKLVVFPDLVRASRDGKQIEGIHGEYTECGCVGLKPQQIFMVTLYETLQLADYEPACMTETPCGDDL